MKIYSRKSKTYLDELGGQETRGEGATENGRELCVQTTDAHVLKAPVGIEDTGVLLALALLKHEKLVVLIRDNVDFGGSCEDGGRDNLGDMLLAFLAFAPSGARVEPGTVGDGEAQRSAVEIHRPHAVAAHRLASEELEKFSRHVLLLELGLALGDEVERNADGEGLGQLGGRGGAEGDGLALGNTAGFALESVECDVVFTELVEGVPGVDLVVDPRHCRAGGARARVHLRKRKRFVGRKQIESKGEGNTKQSGDSESG